MKKLVISLILGLVLVLSVSGMALADDPDQIDISWDGSGQVTGSIDTGDAQAYFDTGGDYILGSYSGVETPNTSYPYMNVDSYVGYFNGHVENGYMDSGCARTDSYEGSYGDAGQFSWSWVGVSGGVADMAYRTTTNYAQMRDCCYKYQLSGGHNIVVDAEFYTMDRYINDGDGESGDFYAEGTGTATMDCMNSGASGCWGLSLGSGCGCYTDANFNATGAGHVAVTGIGDNSVTMMGNSIGGGTLQFIADWAGSISIPDWSITAN
jgi:hypothetical protein